MPLRLRVRERLGTSLDPLDRRFALEPGVLQALGEPRSELLEGQGDERLAIAEHEARRPEGADEVLAERAVLEQHVHRGLAADRGIDHREQRGRHEHQRHTAQEDRRRVAGEIADASPADGDKRRSAIGAVGDCRREHAIDLALHLAGLGRLDVDSHRVDARLAQRTLDRIARGLRRVAIDHEDRSRSRSRESRRDQPPAERRHATRLDHDPRRLGRHQRRRDAVPIEAQRLVASIA